LKRIISIFLLIAMLLSVLAIPAFADEEDDNAMSGEGDTDHAVDGAAWYKGKHYLWKVTLFVGKSDQVSRQDSLTEDFHRIGTVVMKKTGWTVSSSTKFGSGTKVDYYDGVAMTMDTTPYIISDANCPAIPIASGGDIETVKAYFGSTGTMSTILNGIADDKDTTKEEMLSQLPFTIGGRTKSGWSYDYIDPNATTNRVPWVIVYEPMVVLNLKDKVTKLAFTATEFSLCEINGWYDWNKSGGSGQNCSSLPERYLPTSVQLEESWFGYPVYGITDGNHRWKHPDVVKGGGWGMRWLPVAIQEPQKPETDYGCSFGSVNTTPAIGSYGNVVINWTNYEEQAGMVQCCLYRGETLVWSAWKTIPAGATIQTSLALLYSSTDRQTLTCTINWESREEETDASDNSDAIYVTPVETKVPPKLDYGVYIWDWDQPDQDSYGLVGFWWTNWTNETGGALCELFMDGELIWSEYKTFGPKEEIEVSMAVYYSGIETHTLEARINYANRDTEKDPTDNSDTLTVTPTRTMDDTYDFSVSELSISQSTVYQGKACTVCFASDNRNRNLSYESILVEVLVDGVVVKSVTLNYPPNGRYRHAYTIYLEDLDAHHIIARINWADRQGEDDQENNSMKTTVIVKPYYEFSVSNLQIEAADCFEGDIVKVTFRTDSWDQYSTYEDVPVELLLDGQVVTTRYMDYAPYSGFNHTWYIVVGAAMTHEITARINWENRTLEASAGNNCTDTVEVIAQEKKDLTIEAVAPNSDYRAGMTVITSYIIHNNSRYDVTPHSENTVSFEAYYYRGDTKVTISAQTWEQAVIPAENHNLVYFQWTVPSNLAGMEICCEATVNADGTVAETHKENNSDILVRTVAEKTFYSTPDTQFEKTGPEGYTVPTVPSQMTESATWRQWVYEDGAFVEKTYGITISETAPVIYPDEDSPSAEYAGGIWQMGSGYGIYVRYCPEIVAVMGCELPSADAYTDVQQAEATFPEFAYEKSVGTMRTLERIDGNWVFAQNPYADGKERLHFTPLWYPNVKYVVSVTASDVWTPAGMISSARNSNPIQITNSAYDDWYVGG